MEDLEKQFITSYESNLAAEGKEICEKILVYIGEKDEMMLEKAKVFCNFFLSYKLDGKLDGINTEKLVERCRKYIENVNYFSRFKSTFNQANRDRRKEKEWKEMRNR